MLGRIDPPFSYARPLKQGTLRPEFTVESQHLLAEPTLALVSGILASHSLNLGTSSGIVLYEIGKQRRAFQARLKEKIAAKKRAAGEA